MGRPHKGHESSESKPRKAKATDRDTRSIEQAERLFGKDDYKDLIAQALTDYGEQAQNVDILDRVRVVHTLENARRTVGLAGNPMFQNFAKEETSSMCLIDGGNCPAQRHVQGCYIMTEALAGATELIADGLKIHTSDLCLVALSCQTLDRNKASVHPAVLYALIMSEILDFFARKGEPVSQQDLPDLWNIHIKEGDPDKCREAQQRVNMSYRLSALVRKFYEAFPTCFLTIIIDRPTSYYKEKYQNWWLKFLGCLFSLTKEERMPRALKIVIGGKGFFVDKGIWNDLSKYRRKELSGSKIKTYRNEASSCSGRMLGLCWKGENGFFEAYS